MILLKNTYKAQFFASINEIPNDLWLKLDESKSTYLKREYLKALSNHHPEIHFFYIALFNNENELIIFSTLQLLIFDIDSVQNDLNFSIDALHKITKKLNLLSNRNPFKILICGNAFISGNKGIYVDPIFGKLNYIQYLYQSILYFTENIPKLKKEVKAFMFKDFNNNSLKKSETLHQFNFYSFKVDPNMILQLNNNWNDFSDYLLAMKTKYRVKAKKAIQLSSSLEIIDINMNNIDFYLDDIKKLYKQVSLNASFNLVEYNIDIFKEFKKTFKQNFVIKVYILGDKLVGFLSGLIHNNNLDAHYVGLDYEFNRSHAIYQRILYDYISIAINNKLSSVNFGRTASEIKSSVGAKSEDLTIYIKHRKTLANKALRLVTDRLNPSEFSEKTPFKEKI